MSKKNRNKGISATKPFSVLKDNYNVKENLKKLRSGTGKENYATELDTFNKDTNNPYYSTIYQNDVSMRSTTSTADRFEKINDKFRSDISVLKSEISGNKEIFIEKLNDKVDKNELKYWIGGAFTLVLLIGSLIYHLSYQHIVSDTNNLKENLNATNRRIDKIDLKIEYIEKENINNKLKQDDNNARISLDKNNE